MTLYTVGHSTHPIAKFIDILQSHGIRKLIDIRRFPASRRHPQFNSEALQQALVACGIQYDHMESLGGRRAPSRHSINLGLRNAQFRGYADYMMTEPFIGAATILKQTAKTGSTAIMCAEADWHHCHRSLVADWMKSNGVRVLHLLAEGSSEEHYYTQAAVIRDGVLSYPRTDGTTLSLFDEQ